jgi:hypothetical protein
MYFFHSLHISLKYDPYSIMIQSPLEGLSAAKIMNRLDVKGSLISAYRGKELVLGIKRARFLFYVFSLRYI